MARGGKNRYTDEQVETIKKFLEASVGMSAEYVAAEIHVSPAAVEGYRNGKKPRSSAVIKDMAAFVERFSEEPNTVTATPPIMQTEEPKGKLIAMTEEEEKLFRYMFRVFIEKYHTLAFDTVQVKKAVAFARTILSDELVDGILINRITREESR